MKILPNSVDMEMVAPPQCECGGQVDLKTVRKNTVNIGRMFYVCATCGAFMWADLVGPTTVMKQRNTINLPPHDQQPAKVAFAKNPNFHEIPQIASPSNQPPQSQIRLLEESQLQINVRNMEKRILSLEDEIRKMRSYVYQEGPGSSE